MKLKELFDRRFAVMLLIALGALLAISPAGTRKAPAVSAGELAATIVNESDHVTAEELAQWLIDKKPEIMIVDLRSAEEYSKYHIPSAVNLPLTRLFEADGIEQLDPGRTIILYSNGGTHAAQAWVLLAQKGIESYVLLGGLNYWAEAILNPQAPADIVADSEILKYQFRKGAAGFFGGEGLTPARNDSAATPAPPKAKVNIQQKKKARAGC